MDLSRPSSKCNFGGESEDSDLDDVPLCLPVDASESNLDAHQDPPMLHASHDSTPSGLSKLKMLRIESLGGRGAGHEVDAASHLPSKSRAIPALSLNSRPQDAAHELEENSGFKNRSRVPLESRELWNQSNAHEEDERRTLSSRSCSQSSRISSTSCTEDRLNPSRFPKERTEGGRISVSLLSHVFATSNQSGESLHEIVAQHISSKLAVDSRDIQLFELNQLGKCDSGDNDKHVAALISKSGFTLSGLEETLSWNQQLQAMQMTNAQTISSLHEDYKEATSENKRLTLACSKKDTEIEKLQEANARMGTEMSSLRSALRLGEEQKEHLVSVISMLKKEFLALRNTIAAGAPT